MGPIHIMLIVIVTLLFLAILYKIWYHPGDSLTVPSDWVGELSNVKSTVTSTGSMCDITGDLNMVDMNGSKSVATKIECSKCTDYMSLQAAGSCKYLDETCKSVGDAVPCPFDYA